MDLVSFTGGTETGRAIMAAAGRRLVPTTMELGGKSANIIFDSADLDQALNGALLGIFSNNLDEFFRVRVAEVRRLASLSTAGNRQQYRELLELIQDRVVELQADFERVSFAIMVTT